MRTRQRVSASLRALSVLGAHAILAILAIFAIGATSACGSGEAVVAPADVGVEVDADAKAETAATCGAEGEACATPGALLATCPCAEGQGAILLCCTGASLARALACTDVALHPSCAGFASPGDAAGTSDGAAGGGD